MDSFNGEFKWDNLPLDIFNFLTLSVQLAVSQVWNQDLSAAAHVELPFRLEASFKLSKKKKKKSLPDVRCRTDDWLLKPNNPFYECET